jgi:O-antigen biosynthesis protein
MRNLFDAVISFFWQHFFQWNSHCFEITTNRSLTPSTVKNQHDQHINYQLKSKLSSGWYMLEIQIKVPAARTAGRLRLKSDHELNISQFLAFPIYSGRICKRLVYLDCRQYLIVELNLQQDSIDLHQLRIVRVSKKFAHSRMLAKLRALHPRYKVSMTKQRRLGELAVEAAGSLPKLWTDYCDLFDETADMSPYPGWIKKFDTLTDDDSKQMRRNMQTFAHQPLVSIVMPVYNPAPEWLEQAIASVQSQIYTNWELCIADDASTDPSVRIVLDRWMQTDPRIKVIFRAQNGHISAASNCALALAQGEWVALLDHDDWLAEDALYWVVDAINQNPLCQLIYSDEDKIDETGVRSDPYFKCAWNQDLFYSQNMFSHLGVYKTSLVRAVGGFREGLEGSQDYDLALRCIEQLPSGQLAPQIQHIPRVLYHWRIHADSTAHNIEAKPYAMVAGERAINEHLARLGVAARAKSVGYGYRVRYQLPAQLPLVSLIIPTRNGLKLLQQCVESILAKTTYANYEIIVMDNGSDDRTTLFYLDELALKPNVRVVRDARPFNYSQLNNAAVKLARGSVVGLINNDIEVISPDWLTEMVSHALRPEVGAVGARLWYSDDTLQHAGVVLGIHGVAGHVHRFLPRGNVGYCGRAALIQSFSAVTGACLVVRKALYEEVGGLNEVELQVACNDIDFCLRLREAGYRNIYTPYAELYHHESASRGFDDTPEKQARSAKEVAYMQQRWGDLLLNDPAYSPNLTLDAEDFSLAWPPRVAPIGQAPAASSS